jgi:DNA-binding NtrC family response regulator
MTNRALISERFKRDGIAVAYANNAHAALQQLANAHPFLIAIDMILPKLNAHSFSNTLKNDENTQGIKIVAFAKHLFTVPLIKPFDNMICTEGSEDVFIDHISNYMTTLSIR